MLPVGGVISRHASGVYKFGDDLVNNFLLWIGGLVTLCLGLLFAAPHFIDWNGYRGVIEEEASRYFGRAVRVGGEVNLRALPVPYISFDKLSIADTDTTTGAPIIRAENFKMWLSVPPLLQGVMEAHHVELRRPVIELVSNDQGGGNWQSLRLSKGSMSYLPGGFALEALDVIDGQVVLRNSAGAELTRFEDINGTLSALAIEGPYKFNGNFKWQDEVRNLRFATARPNPAGDVRLKTSISAPDNSRSVVLDGVMSTAGGATTFTGDATAKLSGLPKPGAESDGAAPRRQTAAFDLKCKLIADTTALQLKDINLALQTDGPPQLMMGRADLKWAKDIALDVDLSSRWIDFDRFSLSSDNPAPLDNARQLLVALGRALPAQADTNVRIAFDQATLGGQALGAIQLAAVRKSGPLKLQEFEASVPGGGKIAISGELSVSKKAPGFKGKLFAEGQSLLKFLRWGLGNDQLASGLTDGPFSLESKLDLSEQSFALTDATADFGDTPLQGGLRMQLGEARSVALDLEGNTIAWNRLSPEPFNVGIVRKLMSRGSAVKTDTAAAADKTTSEDARAPQSSTFAGLAARSDLSLNLKAANLIDGDHTYRDFEGALMVQSGRLSVPVLRFRRDSGLAVDIGAEAGALATREDETAARGEVKGLIAAKSHIAIADLLQFLEASDLDPILRQRLSALAPLRVASVIALGNKSTPATDMRFDGSSRGGRLVANAQFSKGLSVWRQSPVDLSATIENESAARLFALISNSRAFSRSGLDAVKSGRLYVKAAGTPATGLLTRAVVESDGLNLDYYGDVTLAEGNPFAFDGRVDFSADSVREAMALLGVELGDGTKGLAMKGRFDVVRKDATLRLRADPVTVNGSNVSGVVSLTEQTNAPSKLVARVVVDSATLPGVMRTVLAPKKIKATMAPRLRSPLENRTLVKKAAVTSDATALQPAAVPAIWPTEHFDLTPLTNVEGYITATFNSFAFASDGGLALADARLDATVAPGRLAVTSLVGKALGGDTDIAFEIKKAPAGVDLTGTLKMQVGKAPKAKSAEKTETGNSEATAETNQNEQQYAAVLDLAYQARAFAPQGLASDLDGAGKLVLADASLTGLTAKEVRQAAGETLKTQGPISTETFNASLREKLNKGQIKLGSLDIPVTLKDGALNMAPIEIGSADGKTTFASSLEVTSMKFDSEWKIAARDPNAKDDDTSDKALLPAITVMYLGPLTELASVEPRLSTGALEREIAVRKMERDVAELERLRELDEARAKEEEERRKALERSLAEQRRLQAERERQLLQQQQQQDLQLQNPQIGSEGPVGPDGVPVDPSLQDPEAVPEAEAPKPRRRRARKPPPKKDVWNPFQITPY